MLWFALHLPRLSLEAFCATLGPGEARRRPVALVADHRVHSVNRVAAEHGVRPGLKRPTALALCADLMLAEADTTRDAAALQAVVHAALAFTPAVTMQDAHTVLLEVQPSMRLFGGADALRQRLLAALKPLRHQVQLAAAPTAMGAALLAQWHPAAQGDLVLGPHASDLHALQQLLAQAPVWLLGPGCEHWEALQGMGLRHLSDLYHLPRSGLARRVGTHLLDELDRALGAQPDPRVWLQLPPLFESRLELFARAENTEQVLHGAAVLLARLVAWAQARHARVAAFSLRMLHERQRQALLPATELRVELAEPALAPAHLQLLLRERLARIELAAPTLELQLRCSDIVAGHAPNAELFPTHAGATEGLTRLLERLRARLGDAQVQQLVAVADHRPECATQLRPVLTLPASAPASAPGSPPTGPALPWQHPAWLLDPLPLAERHALPLLQGRPLQLLSGPERIESGWWDGHLVARDYYVAATDSGALVWVFRSRLPEASGALPWFLHGRFG